MPESFLLVRAHAAKRLDTGTILHLQDDAGATEQRLVVTDHTRIEITGDWAHVPVVSRRDLLRSLSYSAFKQHRRDDLDVIFDACAA